MDVTSRMVGKRVILETSLKPFDKYRRLGVQEVSRRLFQPWQTLLALGSEHSVLLWVGSGEEVFLWNNDLSATIEWAHYVGHRHREDGNYWHQGKHLPPTYNYREDWGPFTYADLRDIVYALKYVGKQEFDVEITVGIGIDPGPEFCESEFPYRVHREILGSGVPAFIRCEARLEADDRPYAAYPHGIPAGEPFGRFLGRQAASFCRTLGFDHVWFSNGLGFSDTPWQFPTAETLPEAVSPERAEEIAQFWMTFRESFDEPVVEARGTNWSVGIDLSGKSVSMKDIYATGLLRRSPVNPPTVFFTNSVGLEMTSYLSRISAFPGPFGFRYYISDPWFWQTPWLDRPYNRQPYDIYVPGLVTRLNLEGEIETPQDLALLTIDDRDGEIREDIAREVLPYLYHALREQPDKLGLVTWVYPFDEFHSVFEDDPKVASREPFFYDTYASWAIDVGLPMNSVVSSTVFARLAQEEKWQQLMDSVLFVPACLLGTMGELLGRFVHSGGRVIVYGPLYSTEEQARKLLGVEAIESGFSGQVSVIYRDYVGRERNCSCEHDEVLSAGSIEFLRLSAVSKIIASVEKGTGASTPYAFLRPLGQGVIGWVRGSVSDRRAVDRKAAEVCLRLLGEMGYRIEQIYGDESTLPTQIFVSRRNNEYFFTGYKADLTSSLKISFPQGVPIPENYDLLFEQGEAVIHFPKTIYERCRVFVRQERGKVSNRRLEPMPFGDVVSQYSLTGLEEADVVIYPPLASLGAVTVHPDYELERGPCSVIVRKVSGNLQIRW